MDKPEKLVLNGEEYFSLGRNGALVGIVILLFVVGIALTQTEATLADLVLPMASISAIWFFWLGINIVIGLVHRFGTKREINRLFENEIWGQWQFRSDEWQSLVEAEYQSMFPEGGASAYVGAIYSSIAGLVIAGILVAVGKFAIKDVQAMPVILIVAVAVFLLFVGVGLFQPVQGRNKARKFRQKALQILEPRVWFGAEGVYHEAFGYTSLKELKNVKDRMKTLKAIEFTVKVTTIIGSSGFSSESTHYQPVSFPVPSGYEGQAAQLVRRYRQDRLRD